MITAVIIDDEVDARITLANFIKKKCPTIQIVDFADSVQSGIAAINSFQPNIIFLDIKMNDGTGFDLINKMERINGKIVFTTAFEQYALKALKAGAFEYLLKPINPIEMLEVVNKIISSHFSSNERGSDTDWKTARVGKRIAIHKGDKISFIYSGQIISILSDLNYATINSIVAKKETTSQKIGELEKLLDDDIFYRIHNSTIINCNFVELINKKDNTVKMIDGSVYEISRRKKTSFIKFISGFK